MADLFFAFEGSDFKISMGEETIAQNGSESTGAIDPRYPSEFEGQTTRSAESDSVISPATEYPNSLEDGSILEKETIQEKDRDLNPIVPKETNEDNTSTIQTLSDDCTIPSPVLKGIATVSFFGSDLTSALQILGTRYNRLMNKCKEQASELEALRANAETLSKKCIQECEPKYKILRQKYTQEYSERKPLYNELIELKGNIRVFCRCRPLSTEEVASGYTSVIDIDPMQDSELQIISLDSSRKNFKFDHVFSPKDNQEAVFTEIGSIVNSVLDGYNVCIFAYGQTGTGKTYTMEGTPENRGVNYRALEELFRSSKDRSSMTRFEFSASMWEVYNEKIRDLLVESTDQAAKKLDIKQAADGTQDVPGLVEAQACSIDEVWEMLKTGARNRSVGSTNANELSSRRSHCLVRVTIKGENLVNGQRSKSHLWLVDLAGSERVGKIEVEGERLKESTFINKSLSALGDVISALATKNPHIPYRNSKLTHLLQSSLGGDCKTLMFAQISPSSADLGETLCSLNFASRVRGIEHGPARKQTDPIESFKLKQMAEKLRHEEKESARLNDSFQLMHLKYASRENVFKSKIKDAEQACKNYQMKVTQKNIKDLESQVADEKNSRVPQETKESSKYFKPPVVPFKPRLPLGRITNRMPSSGPSMTNASSTKFAAVHNKENNAWTANSKAQRVSLPTIPKARRVSLSPVMRTIPVQRKRRFCIAIRPSSSSSGMAERSAPLLETKRFESHPRMRLAPLPETKRFESKMQTRHHPRARLAVGTPSTETLDDKGWGRKYSSKYSSPPPLLQSFLLRSKIPSLGSPRQRLRFVSSPGSSSISVQMQKKLCYSVQKRLIVGSPARLKQQPIAVRDREVVGRFGTAQRVLCKKNRRKTLI